jgi:hypothetical protein
MKTSSSIPRWRSCLVFSAGLALIVPACGAVSPLADGASGQAGASGSAGGSGGSAGRGEAGQGDAGQGSAGRGEAGQGSAGRGEAGQGGAGHGGAGMGGGGAGVGAAGSGGARDGGVDAGNPCLGLSQTACSATNGCSVVTCQTCAGGAAYKGCYQIGAESPPQCGAVSCPPPCAGIPEAQCKQLFNCRADYCSACGSSQTFARCSLPSDPPAPCPAIACVQTCAQVTTLAQCELRTDCHSVFVDPGTCGCAAVGCCAHFSRCAAGDKARCTGMPACMIVAPHCEGPYVVAYADTCYDGCVQQKDCAP